MIVVDATPTIDVLDSGELRLILSSGHAGWASYQSLTLAELVEQAGDGLLQQYRPYLVTDLNSGLIALATDLDDYIFVSSLLLGPSDPVPSGFKGTILRTA